MYQAGEVFDELITTTQEIDAIEDPSMHLLHRRNQALIAGYAVGVSTEALREITGLSHSAIKEIRATAPQPVGRRRSARLSGLLVAAARA